MRSDNFLVVFPDSSSQVVSVLSDELKDRGNHREVLIFKFVNGFFYNYVDEHLDWEKVEEERND